MSQLHELNERRSLSQSSLPDEETQNNQTRRLFAIKAYYPMLRPDELFYFEMSKKKLFGMESVSAFSDEGWQRALPVLQIVNTKANFKPIKKTTPFHYTSLSYLAYNPALNVILSIADIHLNVWNSQGFRIESTCTLPEMVRCADFCRVNHKLVAVGYFRTIAIVDLLERKLEKVIEKSDLCLEDTSIVAVRILQSKNLMALLMKNAKQIVIADWERGTVLLSLNTGSKSRAFTFIENNFYMIRTPELVCYKFDETDGKLAADNSKPIEFFDDSMSEKECQNMFGHLLKDDVLARKILQFPFLQRALLKRSGNEGLLYRARLLDANRGFGVSQNTKTLIFFGIEVSSVE